MEIFVNDNLVHTQTGVSRYPGYDTIKLNKLIALEENDTFIVQITAGQYVPISNSSRQHYPSNVSFVGVDGINVDISEDGEVVCIKAYTIPDNSQMNINSSGNTLQVGYFDELGMPLSNATVFVQVNGRQFSQRTDEDGLAIFKLNLPSGRYTATLINPITGKGENITLIIASEYKKPNYTYNVQRTKNINVPKTLHKTYKVSVNDNVIFEGKYFTIQSLNDIFSQNFTNGHLVVYLDGKVVFNATVDDDLSTIIFEIIESLLGSHNLKVEFTVGNNTQTYEQNITIN